MNKNAEIAVKDLRAEEAGKDNSLSLKCLKCGANKVFLTISKDIDDVVKKITAQFKKSHNSCKVCL